MEPFDASAVLRRLGARLKMRHLTLLLLIQQHRSLTRAAEHMASSQPAVTNALAELEGMFGAPLFDRSARGMAPTALGELVLASARAMTNDLAHLVRNMETVASGGAAHVHIGVTPFVAGQILSSAIQRASADGGRRLAVTFHEGMSDPLLRQLQEHALDIVVGRVSSVIDAQQVRFEVLYRQQPRLIASRRLAARMTRDRLDWRKLATLDWILGAPHTALRDQVVGLFLAAGVAPPVPVVESHSSKLMGDMIVASERAVSIVPDDIAEELVRVAGVAIVPYSFEWTLPPIAMFTRTQGVRRAVDDAFANALREVCRKAYGAQA